MPRPLSKYKPIPGYEGLYSIDKSGNIYSERQKKVMKLHPVNGYPHVVLVGKDFRRGHLVHVLVLTTFRGGRPKGMAACHNNGVKSDNRLVNLRWDTYAANEADKKKHGTCKYAIGEQVGSAVLSEGVVIDARRRYSKGCVTYAVLAEEYGVGLTTIRSAISRKTWKHI